MAELGRDQSVRFTAGLDGLLPVRFRKVMRLKRTFARTTPIVGWVPGRSIQLVAIVFQTHASIRERRVRRARRQS